MKAARIVALGLVVGAGTLACAQSAQEMQSAAPAARPGESGDQHGRRLLDEMLTALGGDAWLNKRTSTIQGQTAPFFHGAPTGGVVRFVQYKRYAQGSGAAAVPEATRVEFLTERGVILPGMKKDVVHLWVDGHGYEKTFKGVTDLPEKDVVAYNRRAAHSLEEVMRRWIHAPDTIVVYEGVGTRDRRAVDKVTVLAANNDAVTIEIEQDTHFPLQRSFQWRDEQFKDYDLDEEVYGDWRLVDGVATPLNMTEYHNGDMSAQTFYTKIRFNEALAPEMFEKDKLMMKK